MATSPDSTYVQVNRGSDFAGWKAQWVSYMSLSGLSAESGDKQVQAPLPNHVSSRLLSTTTTSFPVNRDAVVKEFPTVFDGNIRSMDGEE